MEFGLTIRASAISQGENELNETCPAFGSPGVIIAVALALIAPALSFGAVMIAQHYSWQRRLERLRAQREDEGGIV